MERLRNLFRQSEFHVLLLCLAGALWSWPFVSFSNLERLRTMFIYLVVTWALAVFVLFLVSLSLKKRSEKLDPFEETED